MFVVYPFSVFNIKIKFFYNNSVTYSWFINHLDKTDFLTTVYSSFKLFFNREFFFVSPVRETPKYDPGLLEFKYYSVNHTTVQGAFYVPTYRLNSVWISR